MPINRNNDMKPGFSQADFRLKATFYDQHRSAKFPNGRPWWGYVEKSVDGVAMPGVVGELQPDGWNAPWFPESKYIIDSIGRATADGRLQQVGAMYEMRFRIDYARMMQDYTTAMREYYRRAVQEAAALHLRLPEYGGAIEYALRMVVGQPPKSPKIPEAALAGDPWLLGFDTHENEGLARLLVTGNESLPTPTQAEQTVDARDVDMAAMKEQIASLTALLSPKAKDPRKVEQMNRARAAKVAKQAARAASLTEITVP